MKSSQRVEESFWENERKSFPVVEKYTYLANAATVGLRKEIFQVCQNFLSRLQTDADLIWDNLTEQVEEARSLSADLFSGTKEDWGFGINSSHNMGLVASAVKKERGLGEVICVTDEFPSSFVPWRYQGFKIKNIEAENSYFTKDQILDSIDGKTKAVIVSSIQFSTGMKFDFDSLYGELKEKKVLLIVNASQSLGAFPFNVEEVQCDALVSSVHKYLGAGLGMSLIYTKKSFRNKLTWPLAGHASFDDPEFYGRSEKKNIATSFNELGTLPYMNILAIKESLTIIKRIGSEQIAQRILDLSDYLVIKARLLDIEIVSPRDERSIGRTCNSGIVTLRLKNSKKIEAELRKINIITNERRGDLRLSVHYYNNKNDIDVLFAALEKVI